MDSLQSSLPQSLPILFVWADCCWQSAYPGQGHFAVFSMHYREQSSFHSLCPVQQIVAGKVLLEFLHVWQFILKRKIYFWLWSVVYWQFIWSVIFGSNFICIVNSIYPERLPQNKGFSPIEQLWRGLTISINCFTKPVIIITKAPRTLDETSRNCELFFTDTIICIAYSWKQSIVLFRTGIGV